MKSSTLCANPTSSDCLETVLNSFSMGPSFKPAAMTIFFLCTVFFLVMVLIMAYKAWSSKKLDTTELIDRIVNGLFVFLLMVSVTWII